MDSYIFFALGVLSPWPIFYSIMIAMTLFLDTRFTFFFKRNKKLLYYYWAYVLSIVIAMRYILCFRLLGQFRSLNINVVLSKISSFLGDTTYSGLILLGLVGSFWLIYSLLQMVWISVFTKRVLVALYLYYVKNDKFLGICQIPLNWSVKFKYFFVNCLIKYTKNETLSKIVWSIWPISILAIENTIFRLLLPYLWIYDYFVNFGIISKVFLVLPWYYIYSLIRMLWMFILKLDNVQNWHISEKKYGYNRFY